MEAGCDGTWPQVTAAGFLMNAGSPLGFTVEGGLVLEAIVARETAHQRAVRPIVEGPADIFPRNACHRGEVALGDFLPNEDAPLANITAERLGEAQQGARDASLYGKKVCGYQRSSFRHSCDGCKA